MTKVIKYKPEYILKLKNEAKLNDEYNLVFENIISLMSTSTDQKNFKVKVSTNIDLNSNKWHRKRFLTDNEKVKMKINSCLNRYSHITYKEVTLDILKIDFYDYEILGYFIENFVLKYILDHNSDIWDYMLEKIIFSNVKKWKVKARYLMEYFLDLVQDKFNKIISCNYQDHLEKLWNDDIDEFYLLKRMNQGLMKLIAQLFKFNLIIRDTITKILQELTLNINLFYKLELGVALIGYIFNFIEEDEKKKLMEYFSIFLKDKNLNKKVKFMILDFLENNKDKGNTLKMQEYHTDEQVEAILKSSLNDYFNEESIELFSESISKIRLPNKSNKVIYFLILNILDNQDRINDYVLILSKILKKVIKFNNLKYGIIEFLRDYEEFKWDYVNINDTIKNFFKECKSQKILTEDNLNFIFSKIDNNIRDNLCI